MRQAAYIKRVMNKTRFFLPLRSSGEVEINFIFNPFSFLLLSIIKEWEASSLSVLHSIKRRWPLRGSLRTAATT